VDVGAGGKPTGLLTGTASQASNAAILAQLNALGIDAEAKCLADFIAEANSRGLTAWKDAGGNTAPWSTIGAINEGLHSQEPTMQLYRDGGLNARIAYHDMANADTAGALEREMALTENAVGFLGDDMFRYLGQGEDMMATMADYNEYAKYAATKRLSVETHVGGPIDAILNGFEMADAIYPVGTLKRRIAHPENGQPSDAQLARGRELDIGWALTWRAAITCASARTP
jgi:predicted amidohydrolase YtcJ